MVASTEPTHRGASSQLASMLRTRELRERARLGKSQNLHGHGENGADQTVPMLNEVFAAGL